MPTLSDIEKQMNLNSTTAPQLGPVPTGPGQIPGLGTVPGLQGTTPLPTVPAPRLAQAAAADRHGPAGRGAAWARRSRRPTPSPPELTMPKLGTHVTTPIGPATITGGTANYQTLAPINGQGGGILIPNGNGTSTLVMPNGAISTSTARIDG